MKLTKPTPLEFLDTHRKWIQAMTSHWSKMYRMPFEDFLQDMIVHILQNVHQYDPRKATATTWIKWTVKWLALFQIRRNNLRPDNVPLSCVPTSRRQSDSAGSDVAREGSGPATNEADRRATGPARRTVFGDRPAVVRVRLAPTSRIIWEIAEEMGIPANTVRFIGLCAMAVLVEPGGSEYEFDW